MLDVCDHTSTGLTTTCVFGLSRSHSLIDADRLTIRSPSLRHPITLTHLPLIILSAILPINRAHFPHLFITVHALP